MLFYQNVAENGPGRARDRRRSFLATIQTSQFAEAKSRDAARFAPRRRTGESRPLRDPAVHNNACEPRNPAFDMFARSQRLRPCHRKRDLQRQSNKTYTTHQPIRDQDILDEALGLLRKKLKETGDPSQLGDDIPFAVVDSTAARLWQPDISLLKYTKRAHTLLARDGRVPVQILVGSSPWRREE